MQNLRLLWRIVVFGCAVMVITLTLTLWSATGNAGLTRYFDSERAEKDAQASNDSIGDLFEEAGAEIDPLDVVENRFALGLIPSGPGKHAVSVITIAGPAIIIAIGSLASLGLLARRKVAPSENIGAATES